jgi:predicted double-glycine peptidase
MNSALRSLALLPVHPSPVIPRPARRGQSGAVPQAKRRKRFEPETALAPVLGTTMLVIGLLVSSVCSAVEQARPSEAAPRRDSSRNLGEVREIAPDGSPIRARVRSWRSLRRENVVIQSLDYSCGSGALATVLSYYFEDDIREQDVLRAIFIRLARSDDPKAELADRIKQGFSMLDLLLAAKDLGYLGAVVRIPISKLEQSKAPVIVRIEKYDYKHFVVLRGIRQGTVYLADPIRGNIRLSIEEFMKQWSGESLFLGKRGFGLPEEHPLAIKKVGPTQPELEVARQALFPLW